MDFTWFPHMGGFWIFPLFCLIFFAVMLLACGGMLLRARHGGGCCGAKSPDKPASDH
ncbi:MAG TPA: hypothetical protein VIV54_15055 [Burkholderiales bacterium]